MAKCRLLLVVLTGAALAACAQPYRDPAMAAAPSERARTSHIDDYFTFKWTETGRQIHGWGNTGR